MNYLESEISALYASAHELCYLGMDGRPIYSDQFTRLNRDVFLRLMLCTTSMAIVMKKRPGCACRF